MVSLVAEQGSNVYRFVADGAVGPGEILGAYAAFLSSVAAHFTLIDLTTATLGPLDDNAMRDLARRMAELGRRRPKAGRAAIVCSRDLDFGQAHAFMTQIALESQPVRFAIFGGLASAITWLTDGCCDQRPGGNDAP